MIAGCSGGGGDDGTTEDGGNGGNGDNGDNGGGGGERQGGALRVTLPADIQEGGGFHPHKTRSTQAWHFMMTFGETLVSVDPISGEIIPELATDWERADDGMSITFTIRQGVQFHPPYDRELTADDVVANWRRLLDPDYGSPRVAPFEGTMIVEDSDRTPEDLVYSDAENEVTFEFINPFPNVLSGVANDGVPIIPMESVDEHGDDLGHIDTGAWTTGPFVWSEGDVNNYYRIERFDDYWREDDEGRTLPYLDEVEYQVIPEASTARSSLIAGDLDIMGSVPGAHYDPLDSESSVTVQAVASTRPDILYLNHWPEANCEWTSDQNVRESLNWAINKHAVNEVAFDGHGEPARTWVPSWFDSEELSYPAIEDQLPDFEIDQVNVEEAQNALEESDYPGLADDGIEIFTTPPEATVQMGTVTQNNLEEAGYSVTLTPTPRPSGWGQWLGQWENNGPPNDQCLMLQNISRKSYHPADWLPFALGTGSYGNQQYWSDDRTDQLIEDAMSGTTVEERREVWEELLIYASEQVTSPTLVWEPVMRAWSNSVQGFEADPFGKYYFSTVWKEQ